MRAVSLFTGVGGFEIGFDRTGIETVLQAERNALCLEVLKRHYPQTERVHDVRNVRGGGRLGAVDLVYGGFPCQDISVAGGRAGLGGSRSGEWFEFARVLRDLRPRWAIVENVAGLLSSNSGRDLAVILAGLDDLGFDAGWAVLDAQYFAVPQRRERVFIVAGPRGDGAEQVLALCESCGGGPAPRRGAGSHHRPRTEGRARTSGDHLIAIQDARDVAKDQNGVGIGIPGGPMFTLDGNSRHAVAIPDIAWALQERDAKGPDSSTKVGHLIPYAGGVRLLTPREGERLMGWPDDWTRWTSGGREIADGPRRRMIGNGVVSTVAEWIGHRLVAVDRMLRGEQP